MTTTFTKPNNSPNDDDTKTSKGGKIRGLPVTIYNIVGSITVLLLVIIPIYTLLFGYTGAEGVLSQIWNGIDYSGNSTLADDGMLKDIIATLFGILVIGFIVFAPFDLLRSSLWFSLMHIMKSAEFLGDKSKKDNDPEEYDSMKIKIAAYSAIYIVVFLMYFTIIIGLTQEIASGQGLSIIYILGILVKGIAIIGLNTGAIMFLDTKDPAPNYAKGALTYTDEQNNVLAQNNGTNNGIIGALILFAANIVALGIASQVSSYTVEKIQDSDYSQLIEGEEGGLDNLFNQ